MQKTDNLFLLSHEVFLMIHFILSRFWEKMFLSSVILFLTSLIVSLHSFCFGLQLTSIDFNWLNCMRCLIYLKLKNRIWLFFGDIGIFLFEISMFDSKFTLQEFSITSHTKESEFQFNTCSVAQDMVFQATKQHTIRAFLKLRGWFIKSMHSFW